MAASDELVPFVREALARGLPRGEVEGALKRGGWNPALPVHRTCVPGSEERARRRDERRVQDLTRIAQGVDL
jgi:hypothetical protein